MIKFPASVRVHKRLPKEAFYRHLTVSSAFKENFISEVNSIYVEWSLTPKSLNFEKSSFSEEILILIIQLKKQDFHKQLLEIIAKQNPHKLFFILSFKNDMQLAVYHGKLYQSKWMRAEDVYLSAEGFSIEEVWEHLIEKVAFQDLANIPENISIDNKLILRGKIDRLNSEILKIEKAVWKEQQPKKKFELYGQLRALKQELEDITHGQNENENT